MSTFINTNPWISPKKYSNNVSVPLPPPHGWTSSLHSRLRKIPARFFHCHAPVLFDHLAHDHCSCTPVLFDHLDLDHRTPVLFDGLDLDHHASLSFDHLALNLLMPLFSLAILIMINVPLFSVAIFSLFFDLYSSQCSCSLSSSWLWSFYPCSLWSSSLFSGHVFSSLLSLFFVVLLLSLIIFFDQGAVWQQACVFFMLPIKAYVPLPSFLVWIFFCFVFLLFLWVASISWVEIPYCVSGLSNLSSQCLCCLAVVRILWHLSKESADRARQIKMFKYYNALKWEVWWFSNFFIIQITQFIPWHHHD